MESTQESVDIWQKFVAIAGGELEVQKYSLAIRSWVRTCGREKMATVNDTSGTFTLQSEKDPDQCKTIKKLDPRHGERVLGVRLALAGNNDYKYIFRLTKAKELTNNYESRPFEKVMQK